MTLSRVAVRAIGLIAAIGVALPVLTGADCVPTPGAEPPAGGDGQLDGAAADNQDPLAGDNSDGGGLVAAASSITLLSLTWADNYNGGGYQVSAVFTGTLQSASAETVANYRITGTETYAATADLQPDGITVELTFVNVALTPQTAFDISVGGGILDSIGNNVQQITAAVPLANPEEDAPQVATRYWGANVEQDYYRVRVTFNEAMDAESVANVFAYSLRDNFVSYTPWVAALATDGRTALLLFRNVALDSDATVSVGLLPIRDINGNAAETETNQPIASNPADVQPPRLASFVDDNGVVQASVHFLESPGTNGYEVSVEYAEVMDQLTAADETAYSIAGVDAASAVLGDNGRTVTLAYEGVASTDSVLDIDGGTVTDINGRALAAQNNVPILPASFADGGPGVIRLTWLRGDEHTDYYELWALFNKAMDETTVEDPANWRITETTTMPTTVVLSAATDPLTGEIAGRTARVTFQTPMSRSDRVDVSVRGAILDINGQGVAEVSVAVSANANDILAPTVDTTTNPPEWIGGGPSLDTPYRVRIEFTEVMDYASVMTLENYRLPLAPANHPTAVTLADNGRTATLSFSQVAVQLGDLSQLEITAAPTDVNGRHNASLAPLDVLSVPDGEAPEIVEAFWGIDKGPYEVNVAFNETMDADSAANPLAYTVGAITPTSVSLSPNGTAAILIFENATFDPTAELDVASGALAPKDITGEPYTGGGLALPAAPAQKPDVDTSAADIVSAVWAVDSSDYRVMLTFSEAVDAAQASDPVYYEAWRAVPGFSSPESSPTTPLVLAQSAVQQPGGDQVEVVLPTVDNTALPPFAGTFNRYDWLYLAYDGLFMTVADMHGNQPLLLPSVQIGPNPEDTNVWYLTSPFATWGADYYGELIFGSGLSVAGNLEGYEVFANFAFEVLDKASAEDPSNYEISDTGEKPFYAELVPTGDGLITFPGRTVRLLFSDPLGASSSIDVLGHGITDINGNYYTGIFVLDNIPISANFNDVTAPTVLAVVLPPNLNPPPPGQVLVRFSEAMDADTAESMSSYALVGAGPGGTDLYPYAAVLVPNGPSTAASDDGHTVSLYFTVPVWGENLTISVGGLITDINGLPVAETARLVPTPTLP